MFDSISEDEASELHRRLKEDPIAWTEYLMELWEERFWAHIPQVPGPMLDIKFG